MYAVRDEQLERDVALKHLSAQVSRDPMWREQFLREARLLASINHPNIATVYSLEDVQGRHVITMELVDGDLLSNRVHRGPLAVGELLRVGQQIAGALEAAHRCDVIHRDLKPLNVMINSSDLVKVLDFGLATRPSRADSGEGDGVGGDARLHEPRAGSSRADGRALGRVVARVRALRVRHGYARVRRTVGVGVPHANAHPRTRRNPLPRQRPRGVPRGGENVSHPRPRRADRICGDRPSRHRRVDRGHARCGPERSVPADTETPHNLPVSRTTFVGRRAEVEALVDDLDAHPVVTLVGAGGCGKSRLSLQVAREISARFSDGVWLVELAPLVDGTAIDTAVATAMGLRVRGDLAPRDAILRHVAHRRVLLLLDNCEHVLADAAVFAHAVVSRGAEAVVMATSREPLGIEGERVFHVPPLREDGVRLFVERARAVSPHFSVSEHVEPEIRSICSKLDGIPLAIELAAARTAVLSVNEIAERLDDRFRLLTAGSATSMPHHRTLRALIDWSYDLLDDRERAFFGRLSVFVGSFALHAGRRGGLGRRVGGRGKPSTCSRSS